VANTNGKKPHCPTCRCSPAEQLREFPIAGNDRVWKCPNCSKVHGGPFTNAEMMACLPPAPPPEPQDPRIVEADDRWHQGYEDRVKAGNALASLGPKATAEERTEAERAYQFALAVEQELLTERLHVHQRIALEKERNARVAAEEAIAAMIKKTPPRGRPLGARVREAIEARCGGKLA
jgi:hypothetical protein